MAVWTHRSEFSVKTVVCVVLLLTSVQCLTTDLTPSEPLDVDPHRNSHEALVLEGSGLVLTPPKHPVHSPELRPTPEMDGLPTTTTHHQPLPSSDYFTAYQDTVTPSLHIPTESLIITDSELSDSFATDLSDIVSHHDLHASSYIDLDSQLPSVSSSQEADRGPSSFHTPLMSLLMASSSIRAFPEASVTWQNIVTNYPNVTDNESMMLPNAQVFESDNRKLLMLVLRAEDCQKFNKEDFERMLSNLLQKYGFADAVPQVSTAKCYSHLSINLTLNNSVPTLRFLPNVDSKSNVTVDVLNRTFRIVKLEKIDLMLQKSKNSSGNVITAVTRQESITYIALGVCFGLIVMGCVLVFCLKCICWNPPKRRLGKHYPKHERLGPDDYVLTPLPRAASGSQQYKTGPATTKPPAEVVVQSFDTSIVPLGDSAEGSRRDNAAVTYRSTMKSSDQQPTTSGVTSPATSGVTSPTTSGVTDPTTSGVTNPTFERY